MENREYSKPKRTNILLFLSDFLDDTEAEQIIIKKAGKNNLLIMKQTKRVRNRETGKRERRNIMSFSTSLLQFAKDFTIGLKSYIPIVNNPGIPSFSNLRTNSTNSPEIQEELQIMRIKNMLEMAVKEYLEEQEKE